MKPLQNYKKFDHLKFKEALIRELMKHNVNNIDYKIFHEIALSVYAPLKKKHFGANHANFVTREFRKAIMKRARLRNAYLENELKQ